MNPKLIQNIVWALFLVGYIAYKYLAGLHSWNTGYAIQVGIIALLTAVIPYYATSLAAARLDTTRKMTVLLVLPTLLAATGYGIFFVVFVRPSFPDVTALQVMPRGLLPGLAITAIQVFTARAEVTRLTTQ